MMGYETEVSEVIGPSGKTFKIRENSSGSLVAEINGDYRTTGNPLVAYQIDDSGNATGLVGPDGSKLLTAVTSASGDTTGTTDRAALQSAIDSMTAGTVYVKRGNYVVDYDVDLADNITLHLAPGTTIKMRDSFTLNVTLTSGNTTVPVSSVTGIRAGMYVGDEAGDLSAGTPFGSIPHGCTVQSVGASSIVLSDAPTASGAATLRFYPTGNVLRATNADNWSIVCPDGWAHIDGNKDHLYPWSDSSLDSVRNAIRIVSGSNWFIDGIVGQNAYYHGLIAVGKITAPRIGRYRGEGNGFRGIHMHGEAVSGDTSPESVRALFGQLSVSNNGCAAFRSRQNDEVNSGAFIVFDNTNDVQIDSISASDEYGFGAHFSGVASSGAFLTAGDHARRIQVGAINARNCPTGLALYNGVKDIHVGSVKCAADHALVSGCATLDSSNTDKYYVDSTGTVRTLKTRRVQMPVGSIAAYGLRAGHWVHATESTGFGTSSMTAGATIWEVDEGGGSGGTDLLTVFVQNNESGSPYTTVIGSCSLQYVKSLYGLFEYTTAAIGAIKNVSIGDLQVDGAALFGWYSTVSSSEYRYLTHSIANMNFQYCGIGAVNAGSMIDLSIGKWHQENCSLLKIDATAGSSSGGYVAYLQNVVNSQIRQMSSNQSAGWTCENEALRLDSACRNVHIWPVGLKATTVSGMDIMNIQTTAGAGDNGNGYTGPCYIYNPTNRTGASIAIGTSATVNQITRTNANACIRVIDVDTP